MDIVALDRALTLAVNSFHCGFTDSVWKVFSTKEVWFPLYGLIAGLLVWRLGWKKALIYVLALVLCVVATDQFANLVKDSVCRLRPCHDPDMVERGLRLLEGKGSQYGFFSAHAANAFGLAICSFLAFRHNESLHSRLYGWLIFIWAAMVSISRVFVGKHFLGDVLVGTAAGLLTGWLLAIMAKTLVNKLKI